MLKFMKPQSKVISPERLQKQKELFGYAESCFHGFPAKPSAIAWDHKLQILALATKNGQIRIYGKSGVEFYGTQDNTDAAIVKLCFLPGQSRLVCLCEDNSLHLWEIQGSGKKTVLVRKTSTSLEGKLKKISIIVEDADCQNLLVGTEGGNIYILELKGFTMTNDIIYQDVVMQNVPEDYKVNPGPVEVIAPHPTDSNKILIGYQRGLVVLWDRRQLCADQTYTCNQQLECLCWNRDATQFVSSHNDGSYMAWTITSSTPPADGPNTVYGPFPCKPINKIVWKGSKKDSMTIFGGGMPRANYGDRYTVTVMQGEEHVTFNLSSRIVDFIAIDDIETQEVSSLVILSEEEIVFVDLMTEGWPIFQNAYLSPLHSSAVTCPCYVSKVDSEVFEKIKKAGEKQQVGVSKRSWPVAGGNPNLNEQQQKDILLTGHEDGTIRYWDASGVCLTLLYKINTAPIFMSDDMAIDGANAEDDDWPPFRKAGLFDPYSDDPRLAVKKIEMCPHTGQLVVAGTAGQIIMFEIGMDEKEISLQCVDVNLVADNDKFEWKSHGKLDMQKSPISFSQGMQPTVVVQFYPPASCTSLNLHSEWGLVAAGTAHGFALFDYVSKRNLLAKSTLSPLDFINAADEGPMSRRKSLKKSLRESFRRLRRGRSQRKGTKTKEVVTGNKPLPKSPKEDTKDKVEGDKVLENGTSGSSLKENQRADSMTDIESLNSASEDGTETVPETFEDKDVNGNKDSGEALTSVACEILNRSNVNASNRSITDSNSPSECVDGRNKPEEIIPKFKVEESKVTKTSAEVLKISDEEELPSLLLSETNKCMKAISDCLSDDESKDASELEDKMLMETQDVTVKEVPFFYYVTPKGMKSLRKKPKDKIEDVLEDVSPIKEEEKSKVSFLYYVTPKGLASKRQKFQDQRDQSGSFEVDDTTYDSVKDYMTQKEDKEIKKTPFMYYVRPKGFPNPLKKSSKEQSTPTVENDKDGTDSLNIDPNETFEEDLDTMEQKSIPNGCEITESKVDQPIDKAIVIKNSEFGDVQVITSEKSIIEDVLEVKEHHVEVTHKKEVQSVEKETMVMEIVSLNDETPTDCIKKTNNDEQVVEIQSEIKESNTPVKLRKLFNVNKGEEVQSEDSTCNQELTKRRSFIDFFTKKEDSSKTKEEDEKEVARPKSLTQDDKNSKSYKLKFLKRYYHSEETCPGLEDKAKEEALRPKKVKLHKRSKSERDALEPDGSLLSLDAPKQNFFNKLLSNFSKKKGYEDENSSLKRSPSYELAVHHSSVAPNLSSSKKTGFLESSATKLKQFFKKNEDESKEKKEIDTEKPELPETSEPQDISARHPSISTYIDETPVSASPLNPPAPSACSVVPPTETAPLAHPESSPSLVMPNITGSPPSSSSHSSLNDNKLRTSSSSDLKTKSQLPLNTETTETPPNYSPHSSPEHPKMNSPDHPKRKLTFALPFGSAPVEDEAMKPVERAIEARSQTADYIGSMVRCLHLTKCYMASSHLMSATLWAGTNSGAIYIFTIAIPPTEKRVETPITVQLGKEIHLKHAAPVINIMILDGDHKPFPEPMAVKRGTSPSPSTNGPHRVLITSEEQFKVFTLPQLKPYCKYKLTAQEGSRVRKVDVSEFSSTVDKNYKETCLMVVTNQGDISVYSLPEARKQVMAQCIKREDIGGINSVVFTKKGEALYLISAGEMSRISLSAAHITCPKGTIKQSSTKKSDVTAVVTEVTQVSSVEKKVEEVKENGDTSVLSGDITIDSIRDHMDDVKLSDTKAPETSATSVTTTTIVSENSVKDETTKTSISIVKTSKVGSQESTSVQVVETSQADENHTINGTEEAAHEKSITIQNTNEDAEVKRKEEAKSTVS